jgi:hypothetical protein
MGRLFVSFCLFVIAAGCNVTVQGKVLDGISGESVKGAEEGEEGGLRLLLKAVKKDAAGNWIQNADVGPMCLMKETAVKPDGSFTVGDVCASSSDYSIELTDKNLFLAETDTIEMGYDGSVPLDIKVWRSPKSGVYMLQDSTLSRISSSTDLRTDFVFKSDQEVKSPKSIKSVPVIDGGKHLILAGKAATHQVIPLINAGELRLGKSANNSKEWVDAKPWSYVGTTFVSNTEIERNTATMVKEKTIFKEKSGRKTLFLGAESYPAGRYMVMEEGAKRGWIVDFGAAQKGPGE